MDLLIFDKVSQKYSILDWKTSKEIKTDSYKMKTGNKPETNDLLDCKFNHYALQLSLYRYLLEKNYDIMLDDQLIIHLDTNTVHGYSPNEKLLGTIPFSLKAFLAPGSKIPTSILPASSFKYRQAL